MDAINREMKNLKVDFDVLEDESKITDGHKKASSRLVFDACMHDILSIRLNGINIVIGPQNLSVLPFLELCLDRLFT